MIWQMVLFLEVLCLSLYANDLLLYKIISCTDDYASLQLDINSVANWINQQHLSLNVKCMTVTCKASTKLCKPTCIATEWGTHGKGN